MKHVMIAAALLMGTAAVAQTADPAMDPPATPDKPMTTDGMAAPTDPAATAADPMAAPADAMSAPAPTTDPMATPAPAGGAVTMGAPVDNPPPPPPAEYPRCSATVTDQCIQRGG